MRCFYRLFPSVVVIGCFHALILSVVSIRCFSSVVSVRHFHLLFSSIVLFGRCPQAVHKIGKSGSAAGPAPSTEALFLAACRSLAYSVSAAAAESSPLDALRGSSSVGVDGAPGSAADPGDVSRRKYLRQVAGVLRRAAGESGIGDVVSPHECELFWALACAQSHESSSL